MPTWPSSGAWPASGSWPTSGSWPASGNWPGGIVPLSGFTDLTASETNLYFADTSTYTLTGSAPNQYYNKDPYARLVLTTANTSLTIEAFATSSGLNDTVGVFVNGVLNQTVTFTSYGAKQQIAITLPAGAKTVELTEFARITGVSAASYLLIPRPTTVASCLLGYGDSIPTGFNASPFFVSYMVLLRYYARTAATRVLAVAGSSIFGDTNNGAATASVAASLAARFADCTGECILHIEKGTNDYKFGTTGAGTGGTCSAATYAALLGGLIDAFHALVPSAIVFVNSLFSRSDETTNAFGSTWVDFNTAIAGVVSARSSYCRLTDGSQAFTLAQSSDGLHPNNSGHASTANYLREQFGQINPASSSLTISSTTLLTAPPTTLQSKLRADTGITSTGASPDKITSITDVGLLGSTWVQRAANSGPEKTTVSSKAAIKFDTSSALESLHTTLGTANWAFLSKSGFTGVWRLRGTTTEDGVLLDTNGLAAGANGLYVQLINASRAINVRVGNASGTFCYNLTTASNKLPVVGTSFTLDVRFTQSGGLIIRVDKVVAATQATTGTLPTAAPGSVPELGARIGGNTVGLNAYLFEQQLYSDVSGASLDDTTLNAIVDQMVSDWP